MYHDTTPLAPSSYWKISPSTLLSLLLLTIADFDCIAHCLASSSASFHLLDHIAFACSHVVKSQNMLDLDFIQHVILFRDYLFETLNF